MKKAWRKVELEAEELEQLCEALPSWRHEYRHLGKDAHDARIKVVQFDTFQVSATSFATDMVVRGAIPRGCFAVGIPLGNEVNYCGKRRKSRQIVMASHREIFDHHNVGGLTELVVILPEETVNNHTTARLDLEAFKLSKTGLVDVKAPGGLAQSVLSFLSSESPRENWSTLFLDQLFSDLTLPGKPDRLPARRRAARLAFDLLADAPQYPHTIVALCEKTGATERTLFRGFKELYGVSPRVALKALRLELAQSILKRGEVETVTQAAVASGIEHLGRFSLDYRRKFGEKPSETLAGAGVGRAVASIRALPND